MAQHRNADHIRAAILIESDRLADAFHYICRLADQPRMFHRAACTFYFALGGCELKNMRRFSERWLNWTTGWYTRTSNPLNVTGHVTTI